MSRDPFVIPARDLPPEQSGPADAPPPPEDDLPGEAAMQRASRLVARPWRPGWFWSLLVTLLGLMLTVALYEYLAGLLARLPAIGLAATVLTALLAATVALQALREFHAFRRLARITDLRAEAAAALASEDRAAAERLSLRLERFYSGRPDLRWSAERLAEQRADMLDADALVALTERSLLAPLDAAASREIVAAVRTVAGVTALVPLAFADVLAALSMNLRMIRRIAEIYGAHAGFFGSWRLMRWVATHLIATGAVAVGDDMISSVAGGSALSRVSRRFGEGVVNGALTARVGIAAMEVCRPLPFGALPRPRVTAIVRGALTGLFGSPAPGERGS